MLSISPTKNKTEKIPVQKAKTRNMRSICLLPPSFCNHYPSIGSHSASYQIIEYKLIIYEINFDCKCLIGGKSVSPLFISTTTSYNASKIRNISPKLYSCFFDFLLNNRLIAKGIIPKVRYANGGRSAFLASRSCFLTSFG